MKKKKQEAMRESNEVGWVEDKCQLQREWGSGSLSKEPSRSCWSGRTLQVKEHQGLKSLEEDLAMRSKRGGEERKKKQGWRGVCTWVGQILEAMEYKEKNKHKF